MIMKTKPPTKRARLESCSPSPSERIPKELIAGGSESLNKTGAVEHGSSLHPSISSCVPFQSLEIPDLENYTRISYFSSGDLTDPMSIEDLDTIQLELERMQCCLALRKRIFDESKKFLNISPSTTTSAKSSIHEDYYDQHHPKKLDKIKNIMETGHVKRTSTSSSIAKLVKNPQYPVKTHVSPISFSGSSKKLNNSASTSSSTFEPIKLKKPKKKVKKVSRMSKSMRARQNRTHSLSDDSSDHPTPHQFWDFTDSYCRDITLDDIDKLENLIESHTSLPDEIFEIPPLGKYFRESSTDGKVQSPLKSDIYRNHEYQLKSDTCGPLTQRLVSALVDDRVNYHNSGGTAGSFINRQGLVKALGLDSTAEKSPTFETRIRQVLKQQGLLSDSEGDPTDDDEIVGEIKRIQQTLTKLHHCNTEKLKQLVGVGKKEQSRISLKNELDAADNEILEAYHLITSSRHKKKPLTKKERDTTSRALENRKIAMDKLIGSTDTKS